MKIKKIKIVIIGREEVDGRGREVGKLYTFSCTKAGVKG